MPSKVDLHCHFVPNVDDGVRSAESGLELLRALQGLGFGFVCATPHMRPGMFDNDKTMLTSAFEAMRQVVVDAGGMPEVGLASEHYFDDVVFERLMKGEGLPYPGRGKATAPREGRRSILIELPPKAFPAQLQHRLFDLGRAGLRPVLAHPERYEPVWKDDRCLDPLLDAGAVLLLDVCALVGKYGRSSKRAAEKLLDEEAYEAACTDCHRPGDASEVEAALTALEKRVGRDEADRLFCEGPAGILGG